MGTTTCPKNESLISTLIEWKWALLSNTAKDIVKGKSFLLHSSFNSSYCPKGGIRSIFVHYTPKSVIDTKGR